MSDWPRIARPFKEAPKGHHPVIVIGSGYGGGVAASRLARAGQQVTVLERGREVPPGEYPTDMASGMDEFQITLGKTGHKLGKADGLYDVRINNDVNVFVGCGLGGTSLINANVAIEPDARLYQHFPAPLNDPATLKPHFDAARTMLGSNPLPDAQDPPCLQALGEVAKGLDLPLERPDINVSFAGGANHAGVLQRPCNHCGDCVSGCNVGAKNTVLMNYLPDAERHGAQLYTGAEVTHLTRDGDKWRVHTENRILTADIVILAAGTLGSTEILLRSDTLSLSPQLGKNFSGNGDIWAFGYNANIKAGEDRQNIYAVGAGVHDPSEGAPYAPGPCIMGMIRHKGAKLEDDILIEQGVMPGALADGYARILPMLEALMGDPFRFGDVITRLQDAADTIKTPDAYKGPVARTLPFLVMSHDASAGYLELRANRVSVRWNHAGQDPAIIAADKILQKSCDAIAAEYLTFPLFQDALGNRLVAVHPIGGCCMGEDASTGVVNAHCEVFDADGGTQPGFYVCDGAVMPRALGVNPHLTITAVAEWAMAELAADKGWTIPMGPGTPRTILPPKVEDGIAFPVVLKGLTNALRSIKSSIERGHTCLAKAKIWCLRRAIASEYKKLLGAAKDDYPFATWRQMNAILKQDKTLKVIALPIIAQALTVLEVVNPKSLSDTLKAFEDIMGDFSPPGGFDEVMRGQLSTIGLDDDPQPHDPYIIAAKAGPAATLTAEIRTNKVRSATDPAGHFDITGGQLVSDAIGGAYNIANGHFRYLVHNEDEVELWHMTYDGDLIPETGTGDPLRFTSFKTIQRREGSHWWHDFTDLRMDVFKPDATKFEKDPKPIARGMVTLDLEDLLHQFNDGHLCYPEGALLECFANFYNTIKTTAPADLPNAFADPENRANMVKGFANFLAKAEKALTRFYQTKTIGKMAEIGLRTYGGVSAYMANFQDQDGKNAPPCPTGEVYEVMTEDNAILQLTRYKGKKGPVMIVGGLGARASSFALPTVDKNFVQALQEKDFDVWLFDYRGSGGLAASQSPFTLDDVAQKDWPAAIEMVRKVSEAKDVQVVAHCMGSMSLFMAMLYQPLPIRSVIASATGPHAMSNWFNFAKADVKLASMMADGLPKELHGLIDSMDLPEDVAKAAKEGLPIFHSKSPSSDWSDELNGAMDLLAWKVPAFAPTPCYSPTCHRIAFSYGPSYRHAQLNQQTHNSIGDLFGPISTHGFKHIAEIFRAGHAVSMDGTINYLDGIDNLTMPIHFIVGDRNQEMLPEATLRTQRWLQDHFPERAHQFTRKAYPDYGHMDTFIGKTADRDIFPDLLAKLEAYP